MQDIKYLLLPWIKHLPETKFDNLVLDSRLIKKNDIFIAINGHRTDGRKYILSAFRKQPAAILIDTEKEHKKITYTKNKNTLFIYIPFLKKKLSAIASRYYGYPYKNKKLIGVTGTNGKTTVAHLIMQWCEHLGINSATIGTLGYGSTKNINTFDDATKSSLNIQKCLSKLKKIKSSIITIELSSHGLDQDRFLSLPLHIAIFTNISRDHLDYHHNMPRYVNAKWKLFSDHTIKHAILNIDDKFGYKWTKKIKSNMTTVSVDRNPPLWHNGNWIKANNISYNKKKYIINFNSSWGSGTIKSLLLGKFNVTNLLLSLACMLNMGFTLKNLTKHSCKLKYIYGRMNFFTTSNKPTVVVDYAHTPDALKQVLYSLKSYNFKRILCVFGCGGNRDIGKRRIMGAIAEKLADNIIITNDNPRNENPTKIAADIKSGMKYHKKTKVILNRKNAIMYAIQVAKINDVVLIAGKGHESFQIFKKHKKYFSDIDIVKTLLMKNNHVKC